MDNTAKRRAIRPSKREISEVDDEESTNGQPIGKNAKREDQAVSFSDVIDPHRKIKELESKLAETLSKLDAARTQANNLFIKKTEFARENDALKTELTELRRSTDTNRTESGNSEQQERVKYLTRQLEKAQRHAYEDRAKYRASVDDLMHRLGDQDVRLDEEKRRAKEDRARIVKLEQKLAQMDDRLGDELLRSSGNVARIEELTHKLAQYDREWKPVEIDHSGNIFKLCPPNSNESIPYWRAREKLVSVAMKLEGGMLGEKVYQHVDKLPELQLLTLECRVCKLTVRRASILTHFFGKQHKKQMRAHDVAVSRGALEFWLGKLKPDALPAVAASVVAVTEAFEIAAGSDSQPVAAPAASREASETPQQQLTEDNAEAATKAATLGGNVELHEIGIPSNIFQLCRLDWISSMSFEQAHEKLLFVAMNKEGELIERFMRVAAQEEVVSLGCRACEMTLDQEAIITHFLSKGHQKKVTSLGAAVSRAAIDYWADKLQSEQSVAAATESDATAASPAVSEVSKKEEIDN